MSRLFLLAFLLAFRIVPAFASSAEIDPALRPLAFLSGRWISDSADGQEEEYWSQATGKSMVGTFRVLKDGDSVFYEFWVIEVEGGKAIFKMKHFDHNLVGWEDKADLVRLILSVNDQRDVLFSRSDSNLSIRYQLTGDELLSTLRRVKDGKAKIDTFHLHRSKE